MYHNFRRIFMISTNRTTNHEISEVILNRWSPRAYDTKPVADEVLNRIFEAARWAPSAFNNQPWRFIVAKTPEQLEKFYSFIIDANLVWVKNAPAIAILVSEKNYDMHAFDTGTAWGFLALQATKEGLITHPMTGMDKEKAREVLGVPDEYDIQIAIAIGYQGDASILPEKLQAREVPSLRKPLEEIMFEGTFK